MIWTNRNNEKKPYMIDVADENDKEIKIGNQITISET